MRNISSDNLFIGTVVPLILGSISLFSGEDIARFAPFFFGLSGIAFTFSIFEILSDIRESLQYMKKAIEE